MEATEIIQYLETLKFLYTDQSNYLSKDNYMNETEAMFYRTGYKDGFTKGIDAAIEKLRKHKDEQFESE